MVAVNFTALLSSKVTYVLYTVGEESVIRKKQPYITWKPRSVTNENGNTLLHLIIGGECLVYCSTRLAIVVG
jgi:hypothetical protein